MPSGQPISARWQKNVVNAAARKQLEITAAAQGAAVSGSKLGAAHHRHGSSGLGPCKNQWQRIPSSESIVKTAGIRRHLASRTANNRHALLSTPTTRRSAGKANSSTARSKRNCFCLQSRQPMVGLLSGG